VPLLEKAWAKAHGGYDKINLGKASECLRDLTGAPAWTYSMDKFENVGTHIHKSNEKGYIMTTYPDSEIYKEHF
jgi:hypothetical protein